VANPFDPSGFIGQFVEEARDRLKSLTEHLLTLEQEPGSGAAITEALREAHTLKGAAGLLGLSDIGQIAHRMEDLFVLVRDEGRPLEPRAFDLLFEALDITAFRVEQLAHGVTQPADVTTLCQGLEELTGMPAPSRARAEPGTSGESRVGTPGAPASAEDVAPALGPAISRVQRSLRVSVDKIDVLAHLAAEMVIGNLQVSERDAELRRLEGLLRQLRGRVRELRHQMKGHGNGLGSQFEQCAELVDTLRLRMDQFAEDFGRDRVRLNLITEELRQSVLGLTLLPLGSVFDVFPRAVRDLAREFGKEVDLTVRGREAELDKKIIEQVKEPLVHLLRNAIDHGIEPPTDRVQAGKPRRGRIVLAAEQRGNRILITVEDDGRGIDPAALRAAAVQREVASAAELERWSEEDLVGLIFQPGFSTSRRVTDVSGRGVGMDVVKATVDRLHGAVRVQSAPGRGTRIELDLPVSLALQRAILVESGGEHFAVPTATVERIVRAAPNEVRVLQDGRALEVAGETVPLVPLDAVLGLPASEGARGPRPVLVARIFDRRFGLIVDAVEDEQELVFKDLTGRLRDQKALSGVTILGDGQLVLILDIQEVFQLAMRARPGRPAAPAEAGAQGEPGIILVVEDSLIAGELERNILQAAGYRAELAHDGVEALEMLLQRKVDLVIADVDMPRMDGFELTARIRQDQRFRDIPVIIITARESTESRKRGIEAGADAYFPKREFDQRQLLDTVQRLIGR